MAKCERPYHDAYGEDGCLQCSVREGMPWDNNPFLALVNKPKQNKVTKNKRVRRKK